MPDDQAAASLEVPLECVVKRSLPERPLDGGALERARRHEQAVDAAGVQCIGGFPELVLAVLRERPQRSPRGDPLEVGIDA